MFNSYEELVSHIKSIDGQANQLDAIWQYFLSNVQFDYVMLEKFNKVVSDKFVAYIDRIFPSTTEDGRQKAVNFLLNSSNLSDAYWERIKNEYLTPRTDENGNAYYLPMSKVLNLISVDRQEKNGLLIKGIAHDIVGFVKQLCDDVDIPCLVFDGISSGKIDHLWLDIKINGQELFYDITYAIYARDKFSSMRKYSAEDWIGMTPKTLYKYQPTRIISNPKGLNLQKMGLENQVLNFIK